MYQKTRHSAPNGTFTRGGAVRGPPVGLISPVGHTRHQPGRADLEFRPAQPQFTCEPYGWVPTTIMRTGTRLSLALLTLGRVRQETEAEARYQDLIDNLLGCPGVSPPPGGSGFGRGAVRFQKKIFVMFVRGRLVLKLPAGRVDELVAAGEGVRFDANKGTPMREWLSLEPESGLPWLPLAQEALNFARAAQTAGKGR